MYQQIVFLRKFAFKMSANNAFMKAFAIFLVKDFKDDLFCAPF